MAIIEVGFQNSMSHKHEQLESSIDRAVREVISKGFHDPRISGLITVTEVKVHHDLSQAVVSLTVFPADREELTLHGLQDAARYIRREVGDMVRTRTMPQLTFRLDSQVRKQTELLRALDAVKRELAEKDAANPSGPTAEPEQGSPSPS
jgi:ribosome-binding factor A